MNFIYWGVRTLMFCLQFFDVGLRIDSVSEKDSIIIPCDVTAAHGFLLTTFLEPGRSVPYRIENNIQNYEIRFQQIYAQKTVSFDKIGHMQRMKRHVTKLSNQLNIDTHSDQPNDD